MSLVDKFPHISPEQNILFFTFTFPFLPPSINYTEGCKKKLITDIFFIYLIN